MNKPMRSAVAAIFACAALILAAQPAASSEKAQLLDPREEQLLATLDAAELAALLRGEPLAAPVDPAEGLLFHPAEPCRLVDGLEIANAATETRSRLFSAGGCGVRPATGKLLRFSTAASALVRIELRGAGSAGAIALWRAGDARPPAGLLDYEPGRTSIGTAIVPVCREVGLDPCAGGEIAFAVDGGKVALTLDLLGYFAPQPRPASPSGAGGGDSAGGGAEAAAKSLASPFWETGSTAGSIFYDGGKVGIGTGEPLAQLEVVGPATPYPAAKAARFVVRGESASFRDQVTITNQSDAASLTGYGIAFGGKGHHRGGLFARDSGGSASAKGEINLWARSGGNIVLSGGAVGVGAGEPAAQLHVAGDLRLDLGEGLHFRQHADYWGNDYDARLVDLLDLNGTQGNVDGGLVFSSSTIADGERRPILTLRHPSGYPMVGVGTRYPAGLLQIHSRRQSGGGTLSSAGTAVTGAGTAFTSRLVAGSEIAVGDQVRRVTAIASDTALTVNVPFSADLAAAAYSYQLPALLLNGDGKLGLGTGAATLEERLEVVGNLKLSGNLVSDGDLCIGNCP